MRYITAWAGAPITLVYGDKETPEFQRHGVHFFNLLRNASKTVELICIKGVNHFEVMDVSNRQTRACHS